MKEVSKKKPAKWGTLVGSKKKLREILTGEAASESGNENLADDLLYGAAAVSEFTGLTEGQVYHKQATLGLRNLRRA